MSFLTSEEAGLGQPWYSQSNVVAGMGGVLSMQELTTLKNYYQDPLNPFPSTGMSGLGIPASDLARGEFETPKTLVDTTSVGNVHAKRALPWRGRGRKRRPRRGWSKKAMKAGICTEELTAAKAARKSLRSCMKAHRVNEQAGVSAAGTNATTMQYEGEVLNGLGMAGGRAVPIRDLSHGEYETAGRMISHPQAFRLAGLGAGAPVPLRDFVPGEIAPAGTLVDHAQAFGGMGGCCPGLAGPLPISDLIPGEYTPARTLVDHAQGFGALPISDLIPGEYEPASRMVSRHQAFGDWIPFTAGEPEPKGGTQGTWLSPSQVPAWDKESASSLIAQRQNFGGLGDNAVPRKDFVEGEIESAARMLKHRQAFGGLGAGAPVPTSDLVPGELVYGRDIANHPQAFGGLGASGDVVELPDFNLQPICDPQTGACISYATPKEIRQAIGQKIGGQSALINTQAQLPAFYSHPNLGPWGVDPKQAYQYWWAQQAAMERAGNMSPIPVWGSPGFVSPVAPLPASPIAQQNAFNPYANAFPVAGTAVEHF